MKRSIIFYADNNANINDQRTQFTKDDIVRSYEEKIVIVERRNREKQSLQLHTVYTLHLQ